MSFHAHDLVRDDDRRDDLILRAVAELRDVLDNAG
jgi:hypothetical protein